MKLKIGVLFGPTLLSACNLSSDLGRSEPPNIPVGYVCTLAPTTAYSPGYVYRQDADGVANFVGEVPAEVSAYEVLLGRYRANFTREAGLKLVLPPPISPLSTTISAGAAASNTSTVSFSDSFYLVVSDQNMAPVMQAALDLARLRSPEPGDEYFVVRDVIQARGIQINLTSSDRANFGVELSNQLISFAPNANSTGEESLELSGTFPNTLNVCMRAVRLTAPNPDTPIPVEPTDAPLAYASEADLISLLNATPNG